MNGNLAHDLHPGLMGESHMPRGRPRKQDTHGTQGETGNGKGVSKLKAVRLSLEELGRDSKPLELQEHLRNKFNIEMTPSYISKYKSLILSKPKKGKRRGRKPRAAAGTLVVTVAPVGRPAARAGGITLDDLRALKELSSRLGPDKVRELVNLVAR
jgi:hypothetical protein